MYRFFILLTFFCGYFSFQCFSQTIVSGKIEGLEKHRTYKVYLFNLSKQKNIDTISVTGDTFLFTINQPLPEYFLLNFDEQKMGFTCWIQNTDSIKISGNISELIPPKTTSDLHIQRVFNHLLKKGSIEQSLHDSFFYEIKHPLKELLFQYYDSGKQNFIGDEVNQLDSLKTTIFNKLASFIRKNPNNQATQFAIWYLNEDLDIFNNTENKKELGKIIIKHVSPDTPIFKPG